MGRFDRVIAGVAQWQSAALAGGGGGSIPPVPAPSPSPGHALCPSNLYWGDISTAESCACTAGIGVRVPVIPPTPRRGLPTQRGRGRGTSGEHPGCGPGAALNTEGTLGCGVRLLCSPLSAPLSSSRHHGRRIGRGPSLLRRQCAPREGCGVRDLRFPPQIFAAGARGRATCLVNRWGSVRFRSAAPRTLTDGRRLDRGEALFSIRGSFKGRMEVFETSERGSSPRPRTAPQRP